jgi:hypothetical protein
MKHSAASERRYCAVDTATFLLLTSKDQQVRSLASPLKVPFPFCRL